MMMDIYLRIQTHVLVSTLGATCLLHVLGGGSLLVSVSRLEDFYPVLQVGGRFLSPDSQRSGTV